MKHLLLSATLFVGFTAAAQQPTIKFTEYDLSNGLHVIMHEDHSTPIVSVSVMYHVGSKNEDPKRTGFAHFFEHLLFEETENIKRGEYSKMVQSNGGVLNANTSHDRTYYYEILPSNQLELALWMESERLLHAKIDSTGIETQRKVVKEEKKERYDNSPYGHLTNVLFENVYSVHPYRWMPIGTEQYIDEANYSEFMDFYKTFYVPNNAVLVIAGDFVPDQAKAWVEKYFGSIPKGSRPIPRPTVKEPAKTAEKRVVFHDNVQLPAVVLGYNAPSMGEDDFYALSMVCQVLSQGASSRFQKQIVDKDEKALQIGASAIPLEDPGLVYMFGIATYGVGVEELERAMTKEIDRLKSSGVTADEMKKLQNQIENSVVSQNSRLEGIAENLASAYTYFKNTSIVNEELERYKKITAEDLKRVANKYLTKENRVVIHYMPKK